MARTPVARFAEIPFTGIALAALLAAGATLLAPTDVSAQPAPGGSGDFGEPSNSNSTAPTVLTNKNGITILAGGQAAFRGYGSFLRVGAGYNRKLKDSMWLDFGTAILVRRDTDLVFNGGVRWKFGKTSGWRPFLKVGLEVALLLRQADNTKVVVGAMGGGGAGWFSPGGTGLTLEAGVTVGPSFGNGVNVGSTMHFMVGTEIPF